MAYDQRCWDLAQLFLQDGPRCLDADIAKLAQAIQDVCEEHCLRIEREEESPEEEIPDLGPFT